MKVLFSIILLVAVLNSISSQEVFSSAGENATAAGVQLSWTIGESVIETVTSSKTLLTQGFHQSKLSITPVFSVEKELNLKVYPNPVLEKVYIENSTQKKLNFELYGSNGQILKRNGLEPAKNEINVESLASGTYYLKIFRNIEFIRSYKVVKIN